MLSLTNRLTLVFLLIVGSANAATFPSIFEPQFMSSEEGLIFSGTGDDVSFGFQAVALGDINGDGLADLAVGTEAYSENGGIFIIHGSSDLKSMQLSSDSIADIGGTYIPGPNLISAIGDFNGDGLDDWLLKSGDSRTGRPEGAAIVLGRSESYPTPLDINSLDTGSVMQILNKGAPISYQVTALSAVGDVNGDGRDDIAVFSQSEDDEIEQTTISIILGVQGTLPGSLDLASVPDAWRAEVRFTYDFDGTNYTWSGFYEGQNSIGDANADGIDDLLFGQAGTMYLVFGSTDGLPELIDFQQLDGNNGTTLLAYNPDALNNPSERFRAFRLGDYYSRLSPDASGDDIDDLVLLSFDYSAPGDIIHVVFGTSTPWPAEVNVLDLPESAGAVIDGLKWTLRTAGDINDDGVTDWLVEDVRDGIKVIYGTADSLIAYATPDGRNGFTLYPANNYFNTFTGISGDVNGDGIDDLLLGSRDANDAGAAYVVFGRRETGAPDSPINAYAAYSPDSIDLRWELPDGVQAAGFEVLKDGHVIASLDADARSFEDVDGPRFELQIYELVTLSTSGERSAPLIVTANNNVEAFPVLGGEVYSDTLAEIFWVFDNREYDIYRDGVRVDRIGAQSWLDYNYDPGGHVYRIETVNQYFDDRVLRSAPLTLPAQTGTRAPASVSELDFAVYSENTLELFWERAAWGAPPLSYSVSRNGEPVGMTNGASLMDYGIDRHGGYRYEIVTIDSNGRRSGPARLYVSVSNALQAIRPAQPDNITSVGLSETSIQLQWEPSVVGTPPTGYKIYFERKGIGQTSDTNFTVSGLEPDTRYYSFEIVAFNDDGQQSKPVRVGEVVTLGGPLAPESAEALAYGPRTAELFWARVELNATFVSGYDIYRNGSLIDTVSSVSYMDFNLVPDTEYTYKVFSVSDSGVRSEAFASATVVTPAD